MKRGDVVFLRLPRPPVWGHEQFGARPALIVQSDLSAPPAFTAVVIPATSRLSSLRFSYTVRVDPDATNGLQMPSVFLVWQITVVDVQRIQNVVGELARDDMSRIEDQLKKLLGL